MVLGKIQKCFNASERAKWDVMFVVLTTTRKQTDRQSEQKLELKKKRKKNYIFNFHKKYENMKMSILEIYARF